MKVRSSLQFYGTQRGTLVMFNGTGTTDGPNTEVFREVQLDGLTLEDSLSGTNAVMTLIASGRRIDMVLAKVENQPTWTLDQAGLDNCYNTITGWKAEYAAFLAKDSRLPDAGDEGDVLTVVEGEWASAAPIGGGGLIETTYDELAALLDAAEATPGTMYQFEHTPRYYLEGVATSGTPETLTVLATSESTLAPMAWSTENPADICQYDWNPDNWLTDSRYAEDGVIIDDWTGVVYKRTGKRFDPKVYKALITSEAINQTFGELTIGKQYFIYDYKEGDDFTNVGGVNETGNTFTATGTTPTVWSNGSGVLDIEASLPIKTTINDETGVSSTIQWGSEESAYCLIMSENTFIDGKCVPKNLIPSGGLGFIILSPTKVMLYTITEGVVNYTLSFNDTISIEIYPE